MKKKLLSGFLAFVFALQIFIFDTAYAKEINTSTDNLITVGKLSKEDYPEIDSATLLRVAKENREKLKGKKMEKGASLFSTKSPYINGQQPADPDKPKYWANVQGKLTTSGIDGSTFDWDKVIGKGQKVKLLFTQTNGNVMTGITYSLLVDKEGTYTWQASDGKPTYLPLYDVDGKPYTYNVQIERNYSKDIQLIVQESNGTPKAKFRQEGDKQVATISFLDIGIQQVASTKFVSEWHTDLAEADRPQIEGYYKANDDADNNFNFPKNDTTRTILRYSFLENFEEDEDNDQWAFISDELETTPKTVEVKTDTQGLKFEEKNGVKTVKSGEHKFKYDFKYDVIDGGKLTMTEIIPIAFNANGGKFEKFTDPDTEKKIVKEVDYDGTLTSKPKNPTKDRETFKGWSTTADGKTPAKDDDFKNITEKKTFYAIWENNDIVADQLEVKESFKDGTEYVNDFIPTLEQLKGQVKIKDDDIIQILDDDGNPIADADLKDKLYEKLKEDDATEVSRTVNLKAKVTRDDGEIQEVTIPIKVIKNIYEAKTKEGKPSYVPKDYVKVTLDPTTKAEKPQKYFYYVNPEAKVVIPGKDPVGAGDNKFVKWTYDDNGTETEYKLADKPRHQFSAETTIKAQYVSDVIPANEDGSKPNTVPKNYVEVKFVPTDKATDETKADKIYWVNPDKKVTIPVTNPVGKQYFTFKEWKIGVNADGAVYNPTEKQQFKDATNTITATYEETKNIIPYDPSVPDPMVRPDGYVRVTFAADPGLKLKEQKAYYVKKNAGITLGNEELVKPGYKEETGYKFDKWDKEDSLVIEAADILVTAKATKLDDVIPEKDDNDNPNDKPDGYKEVTFVIKDDDKTKGSIDGVAKFYVNPNENVTITPPATKANTGFEFGAWDKDASIPTVYDKDTTITGSFNGLKDVIPKTNPDGSENKPPKGYKKVTFVIDPATGGKIADGEVTVYYVNPAKEVTVPQPKTQAETGYEFKKWDQDTSKAKKYTEDTTVKGNFKKLKDIIPSTDEKGNPNAQPEGYVTVTFDKGANGKSIKGQTVYYVNPKAGKTLADIKKPKVSPETGYKADGWDKKDSQSITGDLTVTAKYKEIDDVIPKTKEDESEKPEGYITVTFDKGANGELEGNTTFYVNPNKAVVLEDKAPTIKPNTGFTSAGWDISINRAIQYKDGDKITAIYNKLGDVIPKTKEDDSEKPEGYITVTFVKGDHGELSGKTVYYVKPNKEVTVPAPTVTANTGYVFEKWDKALTQTFTADNTEITAEYKALDDIIPQKNTDGSDKPEGYHIVSFEAKNGRLEGTTTYYVNPNVAVDLTNTADTITKNPNVGYSKVGAWTPVIESKKYTSDQTYTFNFKELPAIIPEIDENGNKNGKPNGYVMVEFTTNKNGTLAGNRIYFVNPKAKIKLEKLTVPEIKANDGYQVADPNWAVGYDKDTIIEKDMTFTANYNALCEAKIIYKPNNPAWGSVSLGEENIKNDKDLDGSTAKANDGYVFVGWFKNKEDGELVSSDAKFVPVDKFAATYIAVFKKKATNPDDKKINVISKKVWVGVPDGTEKPKVKFQLYRKLENSTEEEKVGKAKDLVNNQVNFGKQDKKDKDGKDYYYFVKELNEDGKPFSNPNYTSKVEGLTVTNTYKTQETEEKFVDVVAYKKWVGVPDGVEKPKIMFQLKRIVANKESENVGNPVLVTGKADENGLIKVDFGKQVAKNDENYFYSYFVIELDENGNKFNHKNYKCDYSSNFLTITNIYQAGGSSVTPTPKPNPQPNPEPNPNPQPNPEPTPNPQPNPEPNPNPQPNPEPTPNPQPNPEPNPNPEPKPNPQPNPEPNPTPQPNPEPTPNPQPNPEPTPNPQPNPEPTPNPQPNPEPTPNPQPNPEPNPNPQPDPEPTPNPQPDPEPIPNPQPDPEPTPNPQADQKTKPDTKPGSDSKNKDGNKKVSNSFAHNRAKKAPGTGVEDTTFATYALTISSALLGLFMKKKKK